MFTKLSIKGVLLTLAFSVFLLNTAYSQNDQLRDSIITKRFEISKFSSLKLEGKFDVIFQQSESNYLLIKTSASIAEMFEINDENGAVHVYSSFDKKKRTKQEQAIPCKVYVYFSTLDYVTSIISGNIICRSTLDLDKFNFENGGSGNYSLNLKCNNATFVNRGSGVLEINFEGEELLIENSGAIDLDLVVNTQKLNLTNQGNGSFFLEGTAKEVTLGKYGLGYFCNTIEEK